MLKRWDNHWFRNRGSVLEFESKQEYYQRASHLLETYTFPSLRHKKIWRLHSEGLSLREIAKEIGINKDKTRSIINIIRKSL